MNDHPRHTQRIEGLQSLRGVLALAVAAGHSWSMLPIATWLDYLALTVLQAGNAVMVFYVLSGYVLSRSLAGGTMSYVNLRRQA